MAPAFLLSPRFKNLLHFGFLLPYLTGVLLVLTANLGPDIIKSPSLSLMEISTRPGIVDPLGPSGAYFGQFGSCYRLYREALTCTPPSPEPSYNATLSSLTTEGSMSPILTNQLPTELIQTPIVHIVGMVFLFVGLLLLFPSLLSARTPLRVSRRKLCPLPVSKYVFMGGIGFAFWGYLLCLTASLAQQSQFGQIADQFNTISIILAASNLGLQHAKLGSIWLQYWAAYALIGFCMPVLTVTFLTWPDVPMEGSWSAESSVEKGNSPGF